MEGKRFRNTVSTLPPILPDVRNEPVCPSPLFNKRAALEPIPKQVGFAGDTKPKEAIYAVRSSEILQDGADGETGSSGARQSAASGGRGNFFSSSSDGYNFDGIRGNVVYLCFLFLGLGTLLPWNFFITGDSYWQYKFRNTSESQDWKPRETELQRLYEPMQVCLSQVVNFAFLFINALFSHMVSQKVRLLTSLIFMLVFFIITTIFVKIDTDGWQSGFFIFTMIIIVLISASGATFQGGLFGVASLFPERFINAVGVGQALGGVFASVTRIISIYFGVDQVTSALIYYLIAVIVMVLTLFEYLYVSRLATEDHQISFLVAAIAVQINLRIIAVIVMVLTLFEYLYVSRLNFFNYYLQSSLIQDNEELETHKRQVGFKNVLREHYEIFKLIWPYGVSVAFVFVVTLAVFPVIAVKVLSTSEHVTWAEKYFQPVCSFLLFNVFDYLGRTIAEFLMWPRRGSWLLFVFAYLRVGFIPLFLLCNHDPRSVIPSVFTNDAYYIVFMSLFGVSNGYVFALLMMYAPRMVSECEGEKVGGMMAAMIGLGLLIGSLSSFGFALIS